MIEAGACLACGRQNRDGLRFCTGCGGALAATEPAQDTRRPGSDDRLDAYAPIAGPVDRVSFHQEQARRRRGTWLNSGVCALAVAILGLPFSLILTPMLMGLTWLLARPFSQEQVLAASPWPDAFRTIDRAINASSTPGAQSPPWWDVVAAVGVLAVPGAVALLVAWLAIVAAFRRAGVGGVLLTLHARPPRTGDLEERQLVNVVEEIAAAAGLPHPAVMLLDTPVPNAAVFGASHREATVIVSRGLLDRLDRDETQGVLAHLLGSAGNGDLVLLRRVLAVFQTYGLFASLGDAAFFRAAAAAPALALLRFVFVHRDAVAAETVNRLLTRGATDMEGMTGEGGDEAEPHPGRFRPRVNALVFTVGQVIGAIGAALLALQIINFLTDNAIPVGELGGVNFAFGLLGVALVCVMIGGLAMALWGLLRFFLWLYTSMFVLPLVALTWRGRRYLADATAVQLTRYPDGIARALTHLAELGAVIPGTEWASHLFVVGPETGRDRAQRGAWLVQRSGRNRWREFQRANPGKSRLDLARELMSSGDPMARLEELGALMAGAQEQHAVEAKTLSGSFGFVSFHPHLWRRLLRLRALGATVDAEDWSKESRKEALVCGCTVLVVAAIVAGFVALVIAGGS